jgi:hypothetical protein
MDALNPLDRSSRSPGLTGGSQAIAVGIGWAMTEQSRLSAELAKMKPTDTAVGKEALSD